MHLQTTLIVPSENLQMKTNNRSHLLNFLHPLHILKKVNTKNLEVKIKQQNNAQYLKVDTCMNNGSSGNIKKNLVSPQKLTEKFIPTDRKLQKKHTNFLQGFRQNIRNMQNFPQVSIKKSKTNHQTKAKNQDVQSNLYFKEDESILEYIMRKIIHDDDQSSSKILRPQVSSQKCFIMFGFSVGFTEIQQFLAMRPEINLTVRLYKYEDNEFYKEVEISQKDDLAIEQISMKLIKILNDSTTLDCEHTTFVINFWKTKKEDFQNLKNESSQKDDKIEIASIYFFPNISTETKVQGKNWMKGKSEQRISYSSQEVQFNSLNQQASSVNYDGNMASLRKSHQNFRILQVLEYYMSLQCHSDHIMISPSESLVIRDFLDSMYEKELSEFYIFIDHKGRSSQNSIYRTIDPTKRSITPLQSTDRKHSSGHQEQANFLSTCSVPQFISINGQIVMNDQFLSKLSSIKPPEPCTDSPQFRKQKQIMYHMKLQQYHEEKQLRKVKRQFTEMINYLNSLIGLEELNYDEISLESLKIIKNAKIKQSTTELKQLVNLSHQKEIRYQDLKSKIALYEKMKTQNHEHHDNKLSFLRKEIINLQKQLNLHKNQISNIYEMTSQQKVFSQSFSQNSPKNLKTEMSQSKSVFNLTQKDNHFKKDKSEGKKNSALLKNQRQPFLQNNFVNGQSRISNKNNFPLPPKNELKDTIGRQSSLNMKNMPIKGPSLLGNRTCSQLFLSKYAPVLEQLRKQKYQQQLQIQRTRCQFEAEKQYQKLKEQYKKATKDLLLILGQCD